MSGTHPAPRFSPWVVCALALLVAALLALSCGQSKASAGPQGSGRASSAVSVESPAKTFTEASAEVSAEVSGGAASGSPSCSKRDGGPDAQIRPGTGTGESAVAPGDRDRSTPVAPDVRSPKIPVGRLLVHPPPSFTVLRI